MISKSVLAAAALVILAGTGSAWAQTTNCPTSFTCGFGAAETLAFSSKGSPPQQAGAPNVYIGYMTFDSSGTNVSVATVGMTNGSFFNATMTGTCSPGSSGLPAKINFSNNGPQWMFVTVNSAAGANGEELEFIQSQDIVGTQSNSNAVRLGTCRSPAP